MHLGILSQSRGDDIKMKKMLQKNNFSLISTLHYFKLVFRSCLLLLAASVYIVAKIKGTPRPLIGLDIPSVMLVLIWLVFIVEMILRFFPSNLESMGCQKQFSRNYIPTNKQLERQLNPGESNNSTLVVVSSWIALNSVVFLLFFLQLIDEGLLLLIALAYSVCDMICILFFCPFQEWMMKNKCCGSCRIYNWDYAMMFTPLILVKDFYSWSLFAVAIILLITWEIFYKVHPERFYENTNAGLSCKNCPEKLCSHKKSLHNFLIKRAKILKETLEKI